MEWKVIGEILSPKSNDVVDTARMGQGLSCSVKILLSSSVLGKIVPAQNLSFTVTLLQPGIANQSTEGKTDNKGIGSVIFGSCRPGQATFGLYDKQVKFSVAPNQRQDISVTLDGDAAEGAAIKVPPGMGISPLLVATIGSPTARIEVESSFDNLPTRAALQSKGNGRWEKNLLIPGNKAPGKYELRVYDIDFFGDPRQTTYNFRLLDITPPKIKIIEPREDDSILLPKGDPTVDVLVRGTIDDQGQSGYQEGTLTGTFNNADIPTIATKPGGEKKVDFTFEFILKGAGLGPNRFSLAAKDNADNTNTYEHEFNVVSSFRPKTIDELLSPRSYLADLIRFVGSHVRHKDNQSVDTALLSTTFMPGVAENNFFGRLSDPVSVMGEQVVNELLPAVYRLRQSYKTQEPTSLFSEYLKVAYHTLLVAHGTSYEELLTLPAIEGPARRKIAERLGLTAPSDNMADGLDLLKPPAEVKTDSDFEGWLETVFGLPRISNLLPDIWTIGKKSGLLAKRQDYLHLRWQAEDADLASAQRALLDPDLVDPEDLNPDHTKALYQLAKNRDGLRALWTQIYKTDTISAALQWLFTADELASLDEIDQKDKDGVPIADRLPSLRLTLPGFRRLRFYQKLLRPLSTSEKEDLAHLLVEVDKLLGRYSNWAKSEQGLNLWPNSSSSGAFVAGHFKRDFLPWRRSIADRLRFERLVSARMSTFEALNAANQRTVLDAQRVALPLFRDRFLSNLPFDPDSLTERLLVDVASTGARTITLIDQATVMLQSLINGIRLRRFEGEHPAAGWKLRTQWSSDPKDDDPDLRLFDEEWEWMGSYASWRSAKRAYLYPENSLFPELRTKETTPYTKTGAFESFMKALRSLAPAAPTVQWIADAVHHSEMSIAEKNFFSYVAIGVMLERAGRYALALDHYRTVYDISKPRNDRAQSWVLQEEKDKPPYITYDDRWTLNSDPHTNARRTAEDNNGEKRFLFRYPYTRFILSRITRCLVLWADAEFAMGTDESRVRALNLYLEAKQVLNFPELDDPPPQALDEAYLPNPMFATLRDHVSASLQKLRRGLSHLGTPAGPDLMRGTDGVSGLLRPTPYRFRVLVDRAKLLIALTQNLEAQYLAALEKRDDVDEKVRREAAIAQIGVETVSLRKLQRSEAVQSFTLAKAQKQRVQIQRDQYRDLIAAGENANERAQMQAIADAATAKQVANIADNALATAQAVQSIGGLDRIILGGGTSAITAGAMTAAIVTRGISQGFVIDKETTATLRGIEASHERRRQEWEHQLALTSQDLLIAQEQIDLAADRTAISEKEYAIALIQQEQAQDMLKFLSTKFTNVEFYEWMSGVLAEVYAFLLRTATTVARQAEGQIAFERQQAPANMIKTDYWTYVNQAGSSSTAPDRRGITASARLLEGLTSLDQYAFDTERRLLNLSHTFSLASLFPVEFDEFRRSGLLSFSTMMRQFDEGFPGHYMRLIKKVRVSLAALIPPTQGIRATLSTLGLSRVVTGDPAFPLLVVRQEPQSVALTSPIASTGVFELDMQSDLLFPFEGMGVDTNWFFELPPAGNLFDYDTLFDVVLTIDYTALNSVELRERVVKQLPRQFIGERVYSVRRDLPDVWYALTNQPSDTPTFTISLSPTSFPPGLTELEIHEIAVLIRLTDGKPATFSLRPSFVKPDRQRIPTTDGDPVPAVLGLVSSRQSGGSIWHSTWQIGTTLVSGPLHVSNRAKTAQSPWTFELSSQAGSLAQTLRDGLVDDIIVIFTYFGLRPAWH